MKIQTGCLKAYKCTFPYIASHDNQIRTQCICITRQGEVIGGAKKKKIVLKIEEVELLWEMIRHVGGKKEEEKDWKDNLR